MRGKPEFNRRRSYRKKYRDDRLIAIAIEGEETEYDYFNELKGEIRNSRLKLHIVERDDWSKSAPEYVLKSLDKFRRKYDLESYDELWLVIDLDRWGNEKLNRVEQETLQKKYFLAVSNPCFEIWLLFHISDINKYSEEEIQEIKENKRLTKKGKTKLEREITRILGDYNKRNIDMRMFYPHIEFAIDQARRLDTFPEERWPNNIGTRVYLLVEKILSTNESSSV